LLLLKSKHKTLEVGRAAATAYARGLVISKKKWTIKAAALNWHLIEQEELSLVQFICLMASMGHGVTKPNVISLIDKYVNLVERNECKAVEVSEKVLHGLFARHKNNIKLVNYGSLDPAHVRKATKETRENVCFQMDT
jgi:hypothetical protein